MKIEGRTMYDW